MRYLSVCSGIEAASVAWRGLGWRAAALSEIAPFPRAVLAHHWPDVPLVGDFTTIKGDEYGPIDLLVGGTPCQSFSVAGLRGGLDDERGNLALEFLRLAQRTRARWLVWENVPGVLSSNGGRDFGAILGGMVELGYGFAYRVLDAQYIRVDGLERAVPQRRRRVFVVGYLGDWRRAAAVLFERESLQGHPAPRRVAGQGFAQDVVSSLVSSGRGVERAGETRGQDPVVAVAFGGNDTRGPIKVSTALNAHGGPMGRMDFESETFLVAPLSEPISFDWQAGGGGTDDSFRGKSRSYIVDKPGRTRAIVANKILAVAFNWQAAGDQTSLGFDPSSRTSGTLSSGQTPAVAFDMRGREGGSQFEGPHDTANIRAASGGSSRSYVAEQWAVRRLTPLECERLQGFPDGWTDIPYRGKQAADGPRYKALGNSMAVNCMRWIGKRVDQVERGAVPMLEAAE